MARRAWARSGCKWDGPKWECSAHWQIGLGRSQSCGAYSTPYLMCMAAPAHTPHARAHTQHRERSTDGAPCVIGGTCNGAHCHLLALPTESAAHSGISIAFKQFHGPGLEPAEDCASFGCAWKGTENAAPASHAICSARCHASDVIAFSMTARSRPDCGHHSGS